MKKIYIIVLLASLTSCGVLNNYYSSSSNYSSSASKSNVSKTADYEGGDSNSGIVSMFITFNPLTENASINMDQTMAKARLVCNNWGYKGEPVYHGGNTTAECLAFDFRASKCVRYKLPVKVYCQN